MTAFLSPDDLTSRRRFDWRVVTKMVMGRYAFTAHRTAQDAQAGAAAITHEQDARCALHYRARFAVPTLIGPNAYSKCTVIHVDVSDPAYPFAPPVGWVVENHESQMPWSPHFTANTPVCDGTIWQPDGSLLLGHFLIHIAKLLNWDEKIAPQYGGWNPDAIAWWKTHLNRPLTPELQYPVIPTDVAYGVEKPGGFRAFKPAGRFKKAM